MPLWNGESCGLFLCGTGRVVVSSSVKHGYGYDLIVSGTRIGLWFVPLWNRESCDLVLYGTGLELYAELLRCYRMGRNAV